MIGSSVCYASRDFVTRARELTDGLYCARRGPGTYGRSLRLPPGSRGGEADRARLLPGSDVCDLPCKLAGDGALIQICHQCDRGPASRIPVQQGCGTALTPGMKPGRVARGTVPSPSFVDVPCVPACNSDQRPVNRSRAFTSGRTTRQERSQLRRPLIPEIASALLTRCSKSARSCS